MSKHTHTNNFDDCEWKCPHETSDPHSCNWKLHLFGCPIHSNDRHWSSEERKQFFEFVQADTSGLQLGISREFLNE